MPEDELDRKLTLLEAAWKFFDDVAARVSLELEKGPRGGGRNRDEIVRHALGWERADLVKRVGVVTPPVVLLTPEGLRSAPRRVRGGAARLQRRGRWGAVATGRSRCWCVTPPLHALDHAWEMEDKDLS